MLRKIYRELAAIRKELQAIHKALESGNKMLMVREPYSSRYKLVRVKTGSEDPTVKERPTEWRRFELTTESQAETERLERVLDGHKLSRRDLAIILFGLRVRPEFDKEHFGI